jgi:glycosyltransferase involved in cell wall biosynthesis
MKPRSARDSTRLLSGAVHLQRAAAARVSALVRRMVRRTTRVVAVLAVHNERPYLSNCLSHLVQNGVDFAIVDNGSTDGSTELLQDARFAPHVAGYQYVPFTGVFAWKDILLAQQQLLSTIDTDWIVLQAPDEVMHSNVPGETLASAIKRLDGKGYDVINFDEFVFLPIDHDYIPDHCGTQPLRHYYFWEPSMRAWRKSRNLSNIAFAGHKVSGASFRLSPESLVNRHYIFRNQGHAYEKYSHRTFDAEELARGWHSDRFEQPVANFTFPPADQLECLASPDDRNLSRGRPRNTHYWLWKKRAMPN